MKLALLVKIDVKDNEDAEKKEKAIRHILNTYHWLTIDSQVVEDIERIPDPKKNKKD